MWILVVAGYMFNDKTCRFVGNLSVKLYARVDNNIPLLLMIAYRLTRESTW